LIRAAVPGALLPARRWRSAMLDAVFSAVGVFFFAGAVLYALACDRL
jgi:hypothetical protein